MFGSLACRMHHNIAVLDIRLERVVQSITGNTEFTRANGGGHMIVV
jgi:hypothetical protein